MFSNSPSGDASRLGSYLSGIVNPQLNRFLSSSYGDGWQAGSSREGLSYGRSGGDVRDHAYVEYPGQPRFLYNFETPTARPFISINGINIPPLFGTGGGGGTSVAGPAGPEGPPGAPGAPGGGSSLITIQNSTGVTIEAGAYVTLEVGSFDNGSSYDPSDPLMTASLEITTPASTGVAQFRPVAIAAEEIVNGATGYAMTGGTAWAWVDFSEAIAASYAVERVPFAAQGGGASGILVNSWVSSPCRILSVTSIEYDGDTDIRLCLVEIDNQRNPITLVQLVEDSASADPERPDYIAVDVNTGLEIPNPTPYTPDNRIEGLGYDPATHGFLSAYKGGTPGTGGIKFGYLTWCNEVPLRYECS
jgi:hypothetical protein